MDIFGVRNFNARTLASSFGTISEFSSHVGINRNRMSALLSSSRNIGVKSARQIEAGCGKPHGWLDIQHSIASASEVSSEEIAIQFSLLFTEISGLTENFCSGRMSKKQIMKSLKVLIEAIQSVNN